MKNRILHSSLNEESINGDEAFVDETLWKPMLKKVRAREFDSLFTILRAHDLAGAKNSPKLQMFLFRAQVGRLGCARNKNIMPI